MRTNKLEKEKALLKEKLNKEMDEYYETFQEAIADGSLNISDIEKFMGEKKAKLRTLINEATGEIASSSESEKKINVPAAEKN